MIFGLLKKRAPENFDYAVYGAIVAQARQPAFYRDYGVPDTVDGRFDLIVLHLIVLFHRFRDEAKPVRDFGQSVFDAFAADMDRNLREMGVADVSVPKKMKKMLAAFYGRLDVYVTAIDAGDVVELSQAIGRNLLPDAADGGQSAFLAEYTISLVECLAGQSVSDLTQGNVSWPDILGAASEPAAPSPGMD